MNTQKLAETFRVTDADSFRLKRYDPRETGGLESKDAALNELSRDIARLGELQEKLYAQNEWSVLLIFQAMDAAGKDSTVKHVMSGINPQGCEVFSFKVPSDEELDHDFMWRCLCRMPQRGRIGIFNRSYYEEVLVTRVHPEILDRQQLPAEARGKQIWRDRFEDINAIERYLTRNGMVIRKFFLNVSPDEQRRRFLERLEDPSKNWKFSAADLPERSRWKEYMSAYEDMIRHTSTKHAPWYVIPADHKWFTHLAVAAAVVNALSEIKPEYPKVDKEGRKKLKALRKQL